VSVRHRVHEGVSLPTQINLEDIQDDRFLKPVLDDDALILYLDDLPEPKQAEGETAPGQAGVPEGDVDSLLQKNSELQAELDLLTKQFSSYRLAVQQTLDQRWGNEGEDDGAGGDDEKRAAGQGTKTDHTDYYFESYSHNGK
jgi:hypothetical protein